MNERHNEPETSDVSRRRLSLRLGILLGVLCVCASALAAQRVAPQFAFLLMLRTDQWEQIITILAALIGGGGLGGVIARVLTLRAERRKLDVDTLGSAWEIINSLTERVKALDADVVQAKEDAAQANKRAEVADARAAAFFAEVKALREQFAAATLSMAAARVEDLSDFAAMWNLLEVPVIFTSEGGRWDLVNVAMCREIGCSRDELLGFGWQTFVLDLEDTMREESAASERNVWGFLNEWRHATEPRTIWLEWYAARYKGGKTMAFAFPSRQRPTRTRRLE